jgi:hypothetical protein
VLASARAALDDSTLAALGLVSVTQQPLPTPPPRRCAAPQIDELPFSAFSDSTAAATLRTHAFLGAPFVVRALATERAPLFTLPAFTASFGNASVHAAATPYASEYGGDESTLLLRDFISAEMGAGGRASGRLVFDAAVLHGPPLAPLAALYARRRAVLAAAVLPDATNAAASLSQLAVGGAGAGALLHFHAAALNVAVVGLKLWRLFPPAQAALGAAPAADWWAAGAGVADGDSAFVDVLQGPGDWVFVPHHWGHATLNLADSVGIAWQV